MRSATRRLTAHDWQERGQEYLRRRNVDPARFVILGKAPKKTPHRGSLKLWLADQIKLRREQGKPPFSAIDLVCHGMQGWRSGATGDPPWLPNCCDAIADGLRDDEALFRLIADPAEGTLAAPIQQSLEFTLAICKTRVTLTPDARKSFEMEARSRGFEVFWTQV